MSFMVLSGVIGFSYKMQEPVAETPGMMFDHLTLSLFRMRFCWKQTTTMTYNYEAPTFIIVAEKREGE